MRKRDGSADNNPVEMKGPLITDWNGTALLIHFLLGHAKYWADTQYREEWRSELQIQKRLIVPEFIEKFVYESPDQ